MARPARAMACDCAGLRSVAGPADKRVYTRPMRGYQSRAQPLMSSVESSKGVESVRNLYPPLRPHFNPCRIEPTRRARGRRHEQAKRLHSPERSPS